jgi:hypothetical protein
MPIVSIHSGAVLIFPVVEAGPLKETQECTGARRGR